MADLQLKDPSSQKVDLGVVYIGDRVMGSHKLVGASSPVGVCNQMMHI
jgi:hypothetical protein